MTATVTTIIPKPERDRRFSELRSAGYRLLNTMRRGSTGYFQTEDDDVFVEFINALNRTKGL